MQVTVYVIVFTQPTVNDIIKKQNRISFLNKITDTLKKKFLDRLYLKLGTYVFCMHFSSEVFT